MSERSFLAPLIREPAGRFILQNTRTRLPVATTLEAAFDSASRKKGLLGRDGLPPGHALIIVPTNLVHTFFMRFPIDMLFVRRDGTVAKARRAVPARRIVGALRGYAVIEMGAGELARSDTKGGDRLEVVRAA